MTTNDSARLDDSSPAADLTAADLNWGTVDIGPVAASVLVAVASGRVVPEGIGQALERCGLAALSAETPVDAVHGGLEKLSGLMREWTPTQRALAVSVLTQRFKAAKIPNAAQILRAAFPQDGRGGLPSPSPRQSPPASVVHSVEPWPEPVDGAAVLGALLALVLRYVVMPRSAAVALALWVLHTYAMDVWDSSPILAVLSPTKQCGKTTVITLSEALVYRAFACTNVTPAVLFRLIEAERPTLLLDEADTWLLDEHSELRGIVNSGHTRTAAVVPRCVGDNHDVSTFSTWAAKMIAMIGKPPETILDRSIVISMNRKAKRETVMRVRSRILEREALPIRQRLRRWTDDHLGNLADADPVVPDPLNDRQADSWRPLLVLADALGGNWPALARQAALELSSQGEDVEDDSLSVQVLADIRQVFAADGDPEFCDTATLLARLADMEERPWAEYRHGKPLNAHALSRLLRPYQILPAGKVRQGPRTLRGYRRQAFMDAWDRYTPLSSDLKAEQRNIRNESGHQLPVSEVAQTVGCSTCQSGTFPIFTETCSVVPLRPETTGSLSSSRSSAAAPLLSDYLSFEEDS